ncbi:MAG: hypothetical protein E7632_08530 [Ruminococcaceae bacterium]|nr:hypothetical protein [Oscillospiraceae bacterium]
MKHSTVDLLAKNTFSSYLWASIRKTSLYAAADRIATLTRRFLFLTRIFHYITIAVTIIETSAVLILIAAALVVLVPLALLLLLILTAADFFIGRRMLMCGELDDTLSKEKIAVIAGVGRYGEGMAQSLAASGYGVIVITADIRRRFFTARCMDGVWYVRHAFFFRLKRTRLSRMPERMIYLL